MIKWWLEIIVFRRYGKKHIKHHDVFPSSILYISKLDFKKSPQSLLTSLFNALDSMSYISEYIVMKFIEHKKKRGNHILIARETACALFLNCKSENLAVKLKL